MHCNCHVSAVSFKELLNNFEETFNNQLYTTYASAVAQLFPPPLWHCLSNLFDTV